MSDNITNKNIKIKKIKIKTETINDIKNKAFASFLKNNLNKKKGEFVTIKKLIDIYTKSKEYKKLLENNIITNRSCKIWKCSMNII